MATTRIPWTQGGGYINAEYNGSGSGPLSFSSSTPNTGLDRQQTVQVAATGSPLAVSVTVAQTGAREEFCTADAGNPPLAGSDSEIFAVLKS